MELHTANKNETLITAGIEIQALNIAIECMLCQIIDNEKDIDWIESILHLASEQKSLPQNGLTIRCASGIEAVPAIDGI
ncbi:hypothetical protein [Escherichia sp. E2593]|uniref:hypothetical protein n=1 Tax=Escherichia sp. E2593 TaxID=2044458 RepID=UPI001FF043A7|nr:hypothetical protein [Escherichia sp. E2593]